MTRWFPRLRFSCPWFGHYIDTEWTVGLGEPVNAILSAKSDPQITLIVALVVRTSAIATRAERVVLHPVVDVCSCV